MSEEGSEPLDELRQRLQQVEEENRRLNERVAALEHVVQRADPEAEAGGEQERLAEQPAARRLELARLVKRAGATWDLLTVEQKRVLVQKAITLLETYRRLRGREGR
jgi:hypothetical protein